RGPLVLCYLEGLTQDEAARRLDCPLGTLKSRLERGRAALQKRLARRGLGLAAVVSTLLLSGKSSAAPLHLRAATVKAATAFTAGSRAGGLVGAKAAALAEGLLKSAFASRLVMALAVVGLILAGLGVGSAARESPASVPPAARAAAPEPAADQGERPQRLASW